MGDGENRVSHTIDVSVASVARMSDWLLGGVENYEADQRACRRVLSVAPEIRRTVRASRRFLKRAVHTLAAEYGVRQFIELGSGLPVQDNVHQVAQRADPRSRVVYIDADPTALAYGRTVLQENSNTLFLHADVRDTAFILEHVKLRRLIDLREPTAVLLVSVLHCLPDEEGPADLVRQWAALLAPGSFLAISQLVCPALDVGAKVTAVMQEETQGRWGRVRQAEQVKEFFKDLDVVSPGLGDVAAWRSGPTVATQPPGGCVEWGGVARVPRCRAGW
ncbi:SAM-dependent methyltransferase [Streptomyces sp. R302]|uniref:SAM-dependent methyltransferase n=1 Tax=unclassified Streptomyces TaxID=2593676 RepID=UPI00145CAB72|nr:MULTISPECIES: SAM-dependent methyltransferase [unclassified Streptomyces]NML54751.1 SAM-dependent methyltransferase [Streptomyces sp. R301]NML80680.1 SAM-dependent methyltransferase [Streptomyces sp. R302]